MPSLLRPSLPRLAATLFLVVAGGILSPTPAQDGAKPATPGAKGEKKPKAGATAAPEPAPTGPTQGLVPFGKMLPIGEKHLGIEIPSFKQGVPSSTVRAASLTKLDDDHMFLEKMDIRLYGTTAEADQDMRVQLKTATYHLPSQVLASEERSRISRADFDLQGDSMVFDTLTGQGKMVGNVRMIIYDSSSLTQAPEPTAKKETTDGTAAPAGQPATPAPSAIAPTTELGSPATNPKK